MTFNYEKFDPEYTRRFRNVQEARQALFFDRKEIEAEVRREVSERLEGKRLALVGAVSALLEHPKALPNHVKHATGYTNWTQLKALIDEAGGYSTGARGTVGERYEILELNDWTSRRAEEPIGFRVKDNESGEEFTLIATGAHNWEKTTYEDGKQVRVETVASGQIGIELVEHIKKLAETHELS